MGRSAWDHERHEPDPDASRTRSLPDNSLWSPAITHPAPLFGILDVLRLPRVCVAEGFMCGFDLQMPSRPFPATDVASCPLTTSVPSAFSDYLKIADAEHRTLLFQLGCLVETPGESRGWLVWKFEHGMLVMASNDPIGKERLAVLWIQDDTKAIASCGYRSPCSTR